MKNPGTIFKLALILGFFFFIHLQTYSQSLYRHLKRVRIEKPDLVRSTETSLKVIDNEPIIVDLPINLAPQQSLYPDQVHINPGDSKGNLKTKSPQPKLEQKKISFQSALELKRAQVVSHTQMQRWMLTMILLYSLGLVLLVVCIVLVVTFNPPLLVIALSILAGLCIVAASIVLPLGLAGVI